MKRDEEEGKLKGEIDTLAVRIKASGKRTLGEYFASLDASSDTVRGQPTSRQMYLDEFEAICNNQAHYYPVLTGDLRTQLSTQSSTSAH